MKISVTCVTCDPVGRLLLLCLLSGEDWENDTSLYVSPTKGELCENHEKAPLERCSQTSVWGKQSVRLSAAAFPNPEGTGRKPGTHFDKTEEG